MSRRLALEGIEIAYEDVGPTAASGATAALPLVMVHGFTGHRDDFARVLDALAGERRVLVPDVRGHGDASHAADTRYDFDAAVDDLRTFLDALGIARCHLLGHSMGGMVVLRFVLAHPDYVASLILMNTSPGRPTGLADAPLEAGSAIALREGMDALQQRVEAATRASGETPSYRAHWEDRYWAHHRRRYHATDPRAYAGFARAMLDQASLVPRLGEIACPTLVVVGEHDTGFVEDAASLAHHIPHARQVTLRDAEHHPHEEVTEAWLAAVSGHLARHDPVDTAEAAS